MERYKYKRTEKSSMERSVIPFAVFQLVDEKITTILVSQGFLDMYGITDREEAIRHMDGDPLADVHPDDKNRVMTAVKKFSTDESVFDVVYRFVANDDCRIIHAFARHSYPAEGVRLAEVWYADEGTYIGEDMLEEDQLSKNFSISLHESSIERKNDLDQLTGLPNMTYFFELARTNRDEVLGNGGHCCIGFADLNGMKYYNKKYGFAEGDKLLIEFSELLVKYFGIGRTCRVAQDNFAFFATLDMLEDNLNSLFKELSESGGQKSITVRVGIYTDLMGIVDTGIAVDRARFASNSIKNINQSGFCYFDESMLKYENNRIYVIDNLDKAIRENWIQAYYQPIVRAANGKVCDEEALARWIDPEKGMLSPAEFIPILEDAKLIYKVDLHIVDQIIKKMKDQKDAGLFLVPMSVNLSRTDFDSCDIVSEICKRVDDAGIGRDKLTIEITESILGSDFDFMKEQIERFQELGFHVWMDDFGSGYSSLDLLQTIHFDVIKLDMRFMKQFDNGDKSKVIITELMKMAMGLKIETVAEGVEREDQVEFLREVGCTRLQGFFYCKPIPYSEIIERNRKGIQIGFENPEESAYYSTLGRINLYDLSVAATDESGTFNQYFDTMPMAIIETDDKMLKITRCNRSYREFLKRIYSGPGDGLSVDFDNPGMDGKSAFIYAVKQCRESCGREYINEEIGMNPSIMVHAFVQWVAKNPVTGITACLLVVLGINSDDDRMITYADIANSLSADYIDLFYVELEDEAFVEFVPNSSSKVLNVEKRGIDFFAQCRRDAKIHLHKDDSDMFVNAFTKENILKAIDEHGAFTLTYRLMLGNGEDYIYVHMKALRMGSDKNHLIVGVNNIDNQLRQQKAIERLQAERATFARISALTGNYICIYTVDPKTNEFMEYSSSTEYDRLGLDKVGKDFFARSREEIEKVIYSEDKPYFDKIFTRENILREVEENGVFIMNYRLMIDGTPTYTRLKAAMIQEKDGPQLIVGVSNVDSQMRRDKEIK